jgi:ferrous iron transport protein B
MTCSARLPVYTVIIAAFVPNTQVLPGVGQQGLVLLGLYVFGVLGAMGAALLLRRTITKGAASGFIMEMPKYQLPTVKDLALGLWSRAYVFLRRAGTMIFGVTVVLWLLLNFPRAENPEDQVNASVAGHIANGLAVVIEPIGFNRDIALALIPAMAAREVAVSALATTYAVGASDDEAQGQALGAQLKTHWSLATALAFLAWFVFAPQCMSTIAVTRRETNGWAWPMFMLGYLFGLAYLAAGLTYWIAVACGLG